MVLRSAAGTAAGGTPTATANHDVATGNPRTGVKRKTRGSSPPPPPPAVGAFTTTPGHDVGATAASAGHATSATRVTRRSAAAAATAVPHPSPFAAAASYSTRALDQLTFAPNGHGPAEPARGEEANLMGAELGSASVSFVYSSRTEGTLYRRPPRLRSTETRCLLVQKRRRRVSPVKARRVEQQSTPFQLNNADAGPSSAALQGVPVIRSASNQSRLSATHQAVETPRPPHPFYPYVSTPFRYPCVHPGQPPPPPGNPKDPRFKRFDPHYGSGKANPLGKAPAVAGLTDVTGPSYMPDANRAAGVQPSTDVQQPFNTCPPDDFAPDFIGWAGLAEQQQQQQQSSVQPSPAQNPNIQPPQPPYPQTLHDSDLSSYFSNDPTYASISALLSASQIPAQQDAFAAAAASLPHDDDEGYPASPGARSDGRGGPLSPSMQGRYSVTRRSECDACVTGRPGHSGHWQRHA